MTAYPTPRETRNAYPEQCPGTDVLASVPTALCRGCGIRPGAHTDGFNLRFNQHVRPDVGDVLYAEYLEHLVDGPARFWVTVTAVYDDGSLDVVKGNWTTAAIPAPVMADCWTILRSEMDRADLTLSLVETTEGSQQQ